MRTKIPFERPGRPTPGIRLVVARVFWLALVSFAVSMFGLGIPPYFDRLSQGILGIDLATGPSGQIVLNPRPGSAAAVAGIRSGDVLLSINHQPLPPSPAAVLDRLNRAGSHVILEVQRANGGSEQITVVRNNYPPAGLDIPRQLWAGYLISLDLILVLSYVSLGALIFWRKSGDALGIIASLGLVLLGIRITPEYGLVWTDTPAGTWAQAIILFVGVATLAPMLSLFPNGRFVPGWTRWFTLFGFTYAGFVVATSMPLRGASPGVVTLRWALDAIFVGIGVAAQIIRYRRTLVLEEKQQTKWVVFGIAVAFTGFYAYGLPPIAMPATLQNSLQFERYELYAMPLLTLALLLVPLTLAISILRYRLWDIDLIIRRTLIYGVLTALLLFVYFVSVTVMQSLLEAMSGERSEIAIILSTLTIAVLFNPLRRRVQEGIDRRFYRYKYDAANVLAAFGATVRDEVDLERLTGALVAVVDETIKPVQVSLWLREGKRKT